MYLKSRTIRKILRSTWAYEKGGTTRKWLLTEHVSLYCWKVFQNTFPMVYHTPWNSKNCSWKLQKKLIAHVVVLNKNVAKRIIQFWVRFYLTIFCYSVCGQWREKKHIYFNSIINFPNKKKIIGYKLLSRTFSPLELIILNFL